MVHCKATSEEDIIRNRISLSLEALRSHNRACLENVSESLEPFHERVRKKINGSKKANFDETGMPVDGKKGWIWIGATKKYAFVQVEMSRGRDVLEKYFPKFRGVAIVDGWK